MDTEIHKQNGSMKRDTQIYYNKIIKLENSTYRNSLFSRWLNLRNFEIDIRKVGSVPSERKPPYEFTTWNI